MKQLLFKITRQKSIQINFSNKDMLDFPVHEHYLYEREEFVIKYDYLPTKKTDEKTVQFIECLKRFLKKKYGAEDVIEFQQNC